MTSDDFWQHLATGGVPGQQKRLAMTGGVRQTTGCGCGSSSSHESSPAVQSMHVCRRQAKQSLLHSADNDFHQFPRLPTQHRPRPRPRSRPPPVANVISRSAAAPASERPTSSASASVRTNCGGDWRRRDGSGDVFAPFRLGLSLRCGVSPCPGGRRSGRGGGGAETLARPVSCEAAVTVAAAVVAVAVVVVWEEGGGYCPVSCGNRRRFSRQLVACGK